MYNQCRNTPNIERDYSSIIGTNILKSDLVLLLQKIFQVEFYGQDDCINEFNYLILN